jgi:hypothetical protein
VNNHRFAVQLGLTLVGLLMGVTLAASCSSLETTQCECPLPRPLLEGEFSELRLEPRGGIDPKLEQVELQMLKLEADVLSLSYTFEGRPGSASFTFSRKYDL